MENPQASLKNGDFQGISVLQGKASQVAKQDADPTNEDPLRRIHGFWKAFHRGTRKGDPRPLTPALWLGKWGKTFSAIEDYDA